MATESTATASIDKNSAELLASNRHKALIDVFGEPFANNYKGPIHWMDYKTLSSPTAVTFYQRDFGYISKVLTYEYQYRSWHGYNQELLDRYAEIITKKLTSMTLLLKNWNNRFSNLMQQNGAEMDSTVFNNVKHLHVPVTSGFARQYFMVLQELDRFNLLAGSANLMGVIDSAQRAEAERGCKRAIRAFAAALRIEVVRIYREATRMIDEQKGKGTTSTDQTAQHEAQGRELSEFGSAMENDGKTDSALDLSGVDPDKVLESAAATANAANKASSRPRKAKTADTAEDTALSAPAAATA